MPGYITHYLGGQSALTASTQKIRNYIAPMDKLFNLGTQGPDIFFYYIPGFISKRLRAVGTQMHHSDLGQFILAMANQIKGYKSPSQRRIVFAYVAGFLAHYAVDVITHGYVYAQTHFPPAGDAVEATRHHHFETSIDVLMLDMMRGQKPAEYKLEKLIMPKEVHKLAAAKATSAAIRQVYARDITPQDVYRAMGQMANLTNVLQSKNGLRKRIIGSIESAFTRTQYVSTLIHMQEVTDTCRDYLNLKKAEWAAPWAPEVYRNESFTELFEMAVDEAAVMIQALYDYVKDEITIERLAEVIQNRSLKTGFEV